MIGMPLVVISMITYNHEKFISKAIDSVLAQKFDNLLLVISDDCSTDKTREICFKYQKLYVDKIVLNFSNSNKGSERNFIDNLKFCLEFKPDYVAILDGDDYWTDDNKLINQINYMNENSRFIATHHNVEVITENEIRNRHLEYISPIDTKKLLNNNKITTSTIIIKSKYLKKVFDSFQIDNCGDRLLFTLLTTFGLIGYIDKIMGVYRQHINGLYSGNKHHINLLNRLNYYYALLTYNIERKYVLDCVYLYYRISIKLLLYYTIKFNYKELINICKHNLKFNKIVIQYI